jgi:hypothetical protein
MQVRKEDSKAELERMPGVKVKYIMLPLTFHKGLKKSLPPFAPVKTNEK